MINQKRISKQNHKTKILGTRIQTDLYGEDLHQMTAVLVVRLQTKVGGEPIHRMNIHLGDLTLDILTQTMNREMVELHLKEKQINPVVVLKELK